MLYHSLGSHVLELQVKYDRCPSALYLIDVDSTHAQPSASQMQFLPLPKGQFVSMRSSAFLYAVVSPVPTCGPESFPSICPLWDFRVLQGEYRRLKWKHEEAASVPMLTEAGEGGPGSPTAEGQQDEELLAEARVLRQHKTRLETRMQILEDHNRQLESQLRRLRELLLQVLYERLVSWREINSSVCTNIKVMYSHSGL